MRSHRSAGSSRLPSLTSRTTRRSLLGLGGVGLTLALAACGSDDADDEPTPTQEPEPTAEPTQADPTPTQEPISSPVSGYLDPTRWEGRSITVATAAAGEYLDALHEAYFDAFAEATGAKVRHTQFGRDGVDGIGSQVESGDVTWDVVLIPTENALPIAQQNALTAIDYNVVDTTDLYPELVMQHAVGQAIYATTIVYPAGSEEIPTDWAQFWDLSTFSGTRALRKSPIGTLEFALLADGVARDALYPLDTARAFAALDRIRDAVIWYEDSKQPVELVRTGQVGLAAAWSVRTALPDVASLVSIQWNGGMLSADSWAIPRGSANTDVAMSFINFATRAVPSATFSRLQPFGPVNTNAFALLRDDIVAALPNAPGNIDKQFFQNWSYWADLEDELATQFDDWVLNPISTPVIAATPAE